MPAGSDSDHWEALTWMGCLYVVHRKFMPQKHTMDYRRLIWNNLNKPQRSTYAGWITRILQEQPVAHISPHPQW